MGPAFNRTQGIALAALILICAAAISGILWATIRPLPPAALAAAPLRFDARRAMAYTKSLARGYPDRVTGSAASRRAAAFLVSQFGALGYRAGVQPFTMWLHGKRVTGQNVIAVSAARRQGPYVGVVAHYDEVTTSRQAAEDDASGVGAMLELARVMRDRPQRMIFAATDAEEWGMIGARHLAPYLHEQGGGAVISIDYLNAGAARGVQLTTSGQFSGYTPLWLRQLARASAERESATVLFSYGAAEWIERALEQSFQDQGPLLDAGIPAVNIVSVPADLNAARARYHTPGDVYANFDPRTFRMIGRTAERLSLALAEPRTREVPLDGFVVSRNRYLPSSAVKAVQLLALMPLLFAGAILGYRRLAETPPLAALLVPPLAALAMARLFALANILPRYELEPAVPKDPFLYHPPPVAALSLIATLLAGYGVLARFGIPVFSKSLLGAWTCAVALTAFIINPYGMWLCLGVFSYAALLFRANTGPRAIASNVMLLALSALPFAAILYYFSREMFLGPFVLWYLVLQTAYGVWPPWVVLTAVFALVLWSGFVRLALASPRIPISRSAPKWIRRRSAQT